MAVIGIILSIVIGAVIVIEIFGETTPEYISAVNKVNETGTCNARSACTYNGSEATNPCRDATNNSLTCPSGQNTSPLQGLFNGNGVAVLAFMAGALLITVRTVMFGKD